MPESSTNGAIIQPNPYAGGQPAPPISMPGQGLQSSPGGSSSNNSQGSGQNTIIIDDEVTFSGPSTGLNGTPQQSGPSQGGNVQPTNQGTDFNKAVTGMVPGANGSGQNQSSGNATGWSQNGNGWCYFDPATGNQVYGWKKIDGYWYYLNKKTGIMATGWVEDGLWYYLDPSDGHMLTNWQYINEEWYYLETTNGDGQMVTGWKLDGDKWYFLFDTGSMARGGWVMIDKKWYCFRDNGELEIGKILEFEGKKYYVNGEGVMITRDDQETVEYKGVTYEVDKDGVCTAIRNPLQEKIETWCEHVDTISQWYVEKVKTYLDGPIVDGSKTRKPYKCPYLNNKEVGDDCSSHVSASLALANFMPYAGYVSQNFNPVEKKYSASLGVKFNKAGFFWYINDANYIPQRGDIFVQHKWYTNDKGEPAQYHHVEVVSSYDLDTDKCNVWSWGAVYGYLPRPQPNWKKRTTGYWRIEE